MEYEKCFQPLQEKGASRNIITAEDQNLTISVDTLVDRGVIVGQATLLDEDVIYFLNPEKPNPQCQPVLLNGDPLYATPQERLKRPSLTREGIRQMENQRPAGWGQVATTTTGNGGWSR